jgi:hypothetical protein
MTRADRLQAQNSAILQVLLNSVEGREELAEAMIEPMLPPELVARRKARKEALDKGCVEVLEEMEMVNDC